VEERRRGIDLFDTQHKRNFNRDILDKVEPPAFNERKLPSNT
jgi:hypothetical protein